MVVVLLLLLPKPQFGIVFFTGTSGQRFARFTYFWNACRNPQTVFTKKNNNMIQTLVGIY